MNYGITIERFKNYPEKSIFALTMFSLFLLPAFHISLLWFEIRMEDLCLPLVILVLIFNRFYIWDNYIKIILAFCLLILISIIVNNRLAKLSDYFEIYKNIKYLIYFIFFVYMLYKHRFTKYIYIIFGLLIIFNFLHYFNINNFNDIIEPYYASGPHLIFFGRNTLGDPDTKRMLGTMGNPNNNGILFLFFTVLFSLKNNSSFFKYFLFYLCFIAILFCQSRTCFIIFVIIFLLNTLYLNRLHYTKIIAIAVIFILTYISLNIFSVFNASDKELSTKYLNEMIQYNMLETGTIQSRFITWNHLWDMIKEKPILGHAPYKEYFYNKKMYSENEYMLMLWRYGFIGLIFYILIIVYPLKILDNFKDNPAPYFLLTIIITALTNNPLSEPRILLMFAFFTALIYALRNKNYLDYEKITVS